MSAKISTTAPAARLVVDLAGRERTHVVEIAGTSVYYFIYALCNF